MTRPLALLDLFSGIGGFSLGLERTGGFKTVAFCEIEEFPRKVLKKHWPEVPIYEDIRNLTAARLRDDGISVDAICGGFPCQDISTAGKGAGIEGERSGLWSEYARLVGELRPQIVFVENVSALLGRGLSKVLGDLAEIGYNAEWHCISASAIGAHHHRDRLWITAFPQISDTEGKRCGEAGQHSQRSAQRSSSGGEVLANAELLERPQSLQNGCESQLARQEPIERHEGAGSVTGCGSVLADADRLHAQGVFTERLNAGLWKIQGERQAGSQDTGVGGIWSSQPDVGRGFDGFPEFMDRHCGRGLSYAESQRKTEVLRKLWCEHVSQALRRTIGGFNRIQQAEVLFSFVREYEAGTDEARLLVAGKEAPENFLRGLRDEGELAGASHRSRHNEQRSDEHSDVVQEVPRLLALNSAPHWTGGGWEDATPRLANGIPQRVDRLKALGNAVVPQIPEMIGRAYLQSVGWNQ